MKYRLVCAASLALACATSRAEFDCSDLHDRKGDTNIYYVMIILDPELAPDQARLRDGLVRIEETLVTPLNALARRLSDKTQGRRLSLELVACAHKINGTDLRRRDMQLLSEAKVVAVLWRGQEGGKPGLMQLAVPVYLHADGAPRSDYEVVTIYQGKAPDPIQRWVEALAHSQLYKPFVSMGLASVYQKEKAYFPAWYALCDSRTGLEDLEDGVLLRPTREVLEGTITKALQKEMGDLERLAGTQTLPGGCSTLAAK